jgi:hypothetical protein
MIKFFRKIRQNLLMENKTGKYFKYAVGEIVLVVIGILIALQINNWNQNKNIQKENTQLIKNILDDFNVNKKRLDKSINLVETLIGHSDRLLKLISKSEITASTDSLKYYTASSFRSVLFQPDLNSYEQALSSGAFGRFDNLKLSNSLANFMEAHKDYIDTNQLANESFYIGIIKDLHKEVGNLESIGFRYFYKDRQYDYELFKNERDYKAFLKKPLFFASVQTTLIFYQNMLDSFKGMQSSAEDIIVELNEVLEISRKG